MKTTLSKEVYKDLIEVNVDLITVVDKSGVIQYENQSAQHVIGYDPDDRIGEIAFDYIHSEDRQMVFERFTDLVKKSAGYTTDSVEFRHQHKDGSWVWLEARGSNREALSDNRYVFTSRDITQRKQYEQDLKQERDRLEKFSGVVSHDLRNPLNVAQGRIELAREQYDSEHMDTAAGALERSLDLIDDMLELAQAGEKVSDMEAVTLPNMVHTCWKNVQTPDATIVADTDATLKADRSRLRQLLENLFRNAIDHGGEGVTVSVGELDNGFYVKDDGPGIPESDRENVLEAGNSTSENGTGLGLSIVEEIVDAHDWDIRITESAGGGARFEITGIEFIAE